MPVHLPKATYRADQLSELAKAIETIERLFPEHDVTFQPQEQSPAIPEKMQNGDSAGEQLVHLVRGSGGHRDAVRAAASLQFTTVHEIAAATGLSKKQVRGVINSPDMIFERSPSESGVQRYKYAGMTKRKR